MKALVYHGNKDLRLESVPDPIPRADEVKLPIDYCGICGTDVEEYLYGPAFISGDSPNPLTGKKMPLVIGHEITGTVVGTGQQVSNVRPGDRVVINGVLTCGECRWCSSQAEVQCPSLAAVGFAIDGGMAEQMVWRASQVVALPDNVTSPEAALVEPGSVALHPVRRSRVQPGEWLAVLGVGTVGTLAMQAAKALGARVLAMDRRPMSLDLARQLGAMATINPGAVDAAKALLDVTDGIGPDVIIDAAGGRETPVQAVQWVRKGGRVVLVAIYTAKPEFDFNSVVGAEVEIIGSIAYQKRDVEEMVGLISSGAMKTSPLISDRIGLEEVIVKGYSRMTAASKEVLKILVAPSGLA